MNSSHIALIAVLSFSAITVASDVTISDKKLAPIFEAASAGDTAALEAELKKGVDPNKLDEESGLSALHYAVAGNHQDAIKLLIKYKANVNLKSKEKWTPLHWAALMEQPEAAQLLIQAGAKRGKMGIKGRKALDLTKKKEVRDIIQKAKVEPGD